LFVTQDKNELLAKRAQRFGTTTPSTPQSAANNTNNATPVTKEVLDKRAQRFGITTQESNNKSDANVKFKKFIFDKVTYA
jgi:hypothetical protein